MVYCSVVCHLAIRPVDLFTLRVMINEYLSRGSDGALRSTYGLNDLGKGDEQAAFLFFFIS